MTTELRTGRTTGSCATAAAMAGTMYLLTNQRLKSISVPLPPGGRLDVPIHRYLPENDSVRVTVIKDGGSDPDATHGCEIQVFVSIDRSPADGLTVTIDGGVGVGRATLPGLPIEVGAPAINPVPLKQIEAGVREAAKTMQSGSIAVIIEVPKGEILARRTLNPRLGILGGISILGTQGIVKPYSHASWKATIEESLDVARAQNLTHAVFTTGRSSERLFQEVFPDVPALAMIQAADFFEFSMQAAAQRNFNRITWTLFFGKLVKQAQGLPYTHARTYHVDFDQLATWCEEAGCSMRHEQEIRDANTARQVLQLLEDDPARPALLDLLIERAKKAARKFSGDACELEYVIFDFDNSRLR